MTQKILVVDDMEETRRSLLRYLTGQGFQAFSAESVREARLMVIERCPDIVILDVDLPDGDGRDLCRAFKSNPKTSAIPVVLISGWMLTEGDQLSGFDCGADDYLLKPFSLPLMLARVRAVLRRFAAAPKQAVLRKCGITVNVPARTVRLKGRETLLTPREFDLLLLFLTRPGRVLSPAQIMDAVWGYDPADEHYPEAIDVHLSHLRKKLGPDFASRIVSLRGLGHRFDP
ncbi:MAG: response regulator transcription factor [Elusimicrobia bacterium]|nr:response regulator transcription factor [Elusimicrobiota bacterium]